jgi:multidrug resistance efflux pump
MGAEATTPCANCERLQAQVEALTATVAQLQATLAQVQAQLAAARKDSSTSSKPPSSDLVKLPKPPLSGGYGRRSRQPVL